MNIDISGRTAVITGGAGAIGSETARVLAASGAFVYINDVNEVMGEQDAEEINESGGRACFVKGSVTNDEDIKKLYEKTCEDGRVVDILMNNAGYNVGFDKRKPISEYDPGAWNQIIDICIDGLYSCCKYFIPGMKKQGFGRIINTASVVGFRVPLRGQSAYACAKSAIINITRSMAINYSECGITVNTVIPGSIMHEKLKGMVYDTPEKEESMRLHIPMRGPGRPKDIAGATLYLSSSLADYVTGCCLNVDGGWASGYALK